ncbi:uncharacterized protein QC763_500040 [Podospora pseudopauciseta]|uniref:Uncharacterized protein n=1 Tax=Podospora pseudopauciseta TaxID=2093780 RepID=A0ABR0H883_9PEZI|nr:hypothetical protein QC763_500040 [Podospora pseudopauciseta]
MSSEEKTAITLPPSVRKRFYEALMIICSMIHILSRTENGTRSPSLDLEGVADKNSQGTFFCFVNKLSQVCDSERGGDTVTAFSVLQPDIIEYRFTSNSRTEISFQTTTRFVTKLLNTLGGISGPELQEARRNGEDSLLFLTLMQQILEFNRPRITKLHIDYQMARHLEFCANACTDADVATLLRALKTLADASLEPLLSDCEFAIKCQLLLRTISKIFRNPHVKEYLRERTREDREEANKTPWTEVYHSLGHLQSYTIAVAIFITARQRWPELFDPGFKVIHVPSSTPAPPPSIRGSPERILSRLTTDKAVLKTFKESTTDAAGHQSHLIDLTTELESTIRSKCKKFHPIVHAEVHLADHILRELRTNNSGLRFYNEAAFGRYIGTSKPTCRLCHLYFDCPLLSSTGRIQVRSSSHNYYHNWRVPHVYPEDGAEAERMRNKVMEWMIENVKPEAVRTVVERFAVRNGHDSNTYPSVPDTESVASMQVGHGGSQSGAGESVRRLGAMDDIIASFGGMRVSVEE